jgi:translation elongation factor EF-Tu-like GTPase
MGWFRRFRKRNEPLTPEEMLAQGHAAMQQAGSSAATAAAAPVPAGDFRLQIEDVFHITGRGLVVTGRIQSGQVRVGQQVTVTRAGNPTATVTVDGIEQFRKVADHAVAGENVGLLFRQLTKDQLASGDVVTAHS